MQLFDDATALQYEFLRLRDETLKSVIVSAAFQQRQKVCTLHGESERREVNGEAKRKSFVLEDIAHC